MAPPPIKKEKTNVAPPVCGERYMHIRRDTLEIEPSFMKKKKKLNFRPFGRKWGEMQDAPLWGRKNNTLSHRLVCRKWYKLYLRSKVCLLHYDFFLVFLWRCYDVYAEYMMLDWVFTLYIRIGKTFFFFNSPLKGFSISLSVFEILRSGLCPTSRDQ